MPAPKSNASRLAANERALIQAVKKRDATKVRELIRRGANVNCGNAEFPFSNVTPLMYACELRDYKIVQYLLKAGADVHARDKSEEMPGEHDKHRLRHLFGELRILDLPHRGTKHQVEVPVDQGAKRLLAMVVSVFAQQGQVVSFHTRTSYE